MGKGKYYAYLLLNTGEKGICDNWPECQKIVAGKSAKYKGFESKSSAEEWLESGADYKKKLTVSEDGIYFDAGTGAGNGVEINVTDKKGKSLLHKVVAKETLNEKGHHFAGDDATNNYGELLALKYALQIAIDENIKRIFGDSKLVIDYWSKWMIKKEVAENTKKLAKEVSLQRKKFEELGGEITLISGGSNPADLGFHKN